MTGEELSTEFVSEHNMAIMKSWVNVRRAADQKLLNRIAVKFSNLASILLLTAFGAQQGLSAGFFRSGRAIDCRKDPRSSRPLFDVSYI